MQKNERRANHTIIAHSVDSTFIHQDVHEAAPEIFFSVFSPYVWCTDVGQVEVGLAAAVCCTMWREDLLWLVLVPVPPSARGC